MTRPKWKCLIPNVRRQRRWLTCAPIYNRRCWDLRRLRARRRGARLPALAVEADENADYAAH